MIRKLMDIGEVYFITAVAPGFMGSEGEPDNGGIS